MVGTDAAENGDDVPRAVRPGEAAALVAAYQQAQAAEMAVRQAMARLGPSAR